MIATGDRARMDASDLKRRLAAARAVKRCSYPTALREAVIAYAAKRRTQRVSRDKIAAELGMSVATLSYWCAPARRAGSLAPVTIVADPASKHDVVVECGPLRVRGLDVAGVAELLKRLA
jgi:hypothetical protein